MKFLDKSGLFYIIEQITKLETADELLIQIYNILHKVLAFSKVSIYELSKERGEPESKTYQILALNIMVHNARSFVVEENKEMKLCLEQKKPVEIKSGSSLFSECLYPVIESTEITYILRLVCGETNDGDRSDLKFLIRIFGNMLTILHEKDKDFLTGLYNRQYYNKISLTINKFQFKEKSLKRDYTHLAIFDIDYFKRVNDIYGHLIGDEVLIHFSGLIKSVFRREDYKIRYGGEEFLVILKEVSDKEAEELLERFRKTVDAHKFPRVEHITVTVGYINFKDEKDPFTICDKADKALYYGKEHGRNQVCSYRENIIKDNEVYTDDITIWD